MRHLSWDSEYVAKTPSRRKAALHQRGKNEEGAIFQANEDKKRKKLDEQNYNRVRRDVEKSLISGGTLSFATSHGPTRYLSSVCAEKDPTQLACYLLELTNNNLKTTTELLQECSRVLTNEGEAVVVECQFDSSCYIPNQKRNRSLWMTLLSSPSSTLQSRAFFWNAK